MKDKPSWQEYLMKYSKEEIKDYLIEEFYGPYYPGIGQIDSFMRLRRMKISLEKMNGLTMQTAEISEKMKKFPKGSRKYNLLFSEWLLLEKEYSNLAKKMLED